MCLTSTIMTHINSLPIINRSFTVLTIKLKYLILKLENSQQHAFVMQNS